MATSSRRKCDEAGTSQPHNKTASGRPHRPEAPTRSWENEPIRDALKPARNVFDRISRNRDEDIRTYLEARHNSTTSKKRDDLPAFSPLNNEINELRDRLKKPGAKNTEAAQLTTTSPFSIEIQQAPLPARFRKRTMATYDGKTNPQDHLDAFNDQMDLLQVTPTIDVLLSHC